MFHLDSLSRPLPSQTKHRAYLTIMSQPKHTCVQRNSFPSGPLILPPPHLHSTHTTPQCRITVQSEGHQGITLNLTKRRNKAVTACLYSLSSDQGFLSFLGRIPLYEFYETTVQIFPRKMNATSFSYKFRGPQSGRVRVTDQQLGLPSPSPGHNLRL